MSTLWAFLRAQFDGASREHSQVDYAGEDTPRPCNDGQDDVRRNDECAGHQLMASATLPRISLGAVLMNRSVRPAFISRPRRISCARPMAMGVRGLSLF